MNFSSAKSATEMRAEVVSYFDDEIATHDRRQAAMPPTCQRDIREAHIRRRSLEIHRGFFADLIVEGVAFEKAG